MVPTGWQRPVTYAVVAVLGLSAAGLARHAWVPDHETREGRFDRPGGAWLVRAAAAASGGGGSLQSDGWDPENGTQTGPGGSFTSADAGMHTASGGDGSLQSDGRHRATGTQTGPGGSFTSADAGKHTASRGESDDQHPAASMQTGPGGSFAKHGCPGGLARWCAGGHQEMDPACGPGPAECPYFLRPRWPNKARGRAPAWRRLWRAMHRTNKADADAAAPKAPLLFVGDSLTHNLRRDADEPASAHAFRAVFSPANAVALGIPGDCTQHLLARLMLNELGDSGGHPPASAVVLMIGSNNLNYLWTGEPVELAGVARAVAALAEYVLFLKPGTPVVTLGILPRGNRCVRLGSGAPCLMQYDETVPAVNAALAPLVEGLGPRSHYLDCSSAFANATSDHWASDKHHLQLPGYNSLWKQCLIPFLRRVVPHLDFNESALL